MTKDEATKAVEILRKQDFRECREFLSKSVDVDRYVSVTWHDGNQWQYRQFTDYQTAINFEKE